MRPDRWTAVTESSFPWEQDALEFLRQHLPNHEPWRAWSNFEFIDDQGRVNEVDLLVLTPRGLILVEIKSRPGIVEGDNHYLDLEQRRQEVHGGQPAPAREPKGQAAGVLAPTAGCYRQE